MRVSDGLPAKYWGLSLILGVGSLPVRLVINIIFNTTVNSNWRLRQKLRYSRDRNLVGHKHGTPE
jgi:hypothetical protein